MEPDKIIYGFDVTEPISIKYPKNIYHSSSSLSSSLSSFQNSLRNSLEDSLEKKASTSDNDIINDIKENYFVKHMRNSHPIVIKKKK
jgi:hypothetical protein